jgi:gamma-carbonic anhydrase
MILEHRGARPTIDPSAYVAPTAVLAPGTVVPIGWIAAGDRPQLLPPDRHDELWAVQRELDFPGTVYGVPRGTPAEELMRRQSEFFAAHREDRECG